VAGLIAKLFGGKPSPAGTEPVPGIGGYTPGAGPAGQTGFPGSTSQVRANRGKTPRAVKIEADTDTGWENGLSGTPQVRQASFRGDVPGSAARSPRATSLVITPQPVVTAQLQQNAPGREFFGGPMLKTSPGLNDTAGGVIDRTGAAAMGLPMADTRDTTTPWTAAQPQIGGNVPGAQNVRNTVAERYKQAPGQLHTYLSAPRPDQAPANPGGQATDGNVHPGAVVTPVTVPSRRFDDGVISWSVLREMPYGGRGDGARGADLNGQRYYATGQAGQFANAGQGEYGIARQNGSQVKRPVGFTQPAPWTANFYDTTSSTGTIGDPNQAPAQQPQAVYYSPGGLRASNGTGRTG
jgi:hypothetical protein